MVKVCLQDLQKFLKFMLQMLMKMEYLTLAMVNFFTEG